RPLPGLACLVASYRRNFRPARIGLSATLCLDGGSSSLVLEELPHRNRAGRHCALPWRGAGRSRLARRGIRRLSAYRFGHFGTCVRRRGYTLGLLPSFRHGHSCSVHRGKVFPRLSAASVRLCRPEGKGGSACVVICSVRGFAFEHLARLGE